jgi:hypothetical protein
MAAEQATAKVLLLQLKLLKVSTRSTVKDKHTLIQ